MAFNAKLKIGSKDNIDVLKCDYALHRDVDSKGKPSSGVYGGTINLSIESTDDTSIVESMVNQYKPISGTVTFKKSDEDAKMKELSWENGYVIRFQEGIDITGQQPMQIDFTVSAEKIKIGSAEHVNGWPK
jgi:hypothetical protein